MFRSIALKTMFLFWFSLQINANAGNNTCGAGMTVINPFHIDIDPMEGLLLINIENDPDSVYIGFEPQVFDDPINGNGMLVIAWRVDGYVDVYHQPGLKPDPSKYDIVGKGLAAMVERPLHGAYFRVEENGVQSWFSFVDIYNREIEVRIHEQSTRRRKPFGLLAPMGHAAENPSAMPMIFLHDFYFVRRKDTQIEVLINGHHHASDKLPMPMDRQRMYFARYSPDPLIATLNPAHNGPLNELQASGELTFKRTGNNFNLKNHNGRYYIESITAHYNEHQLDMVFSPAFPNIAQVMPGDSFKGNFVIEGDRSTGKIKGTYSLVEEDGEIRIHLTPCGGWKPRVSKFSLRFMYTVSGMFKNWPKTYHWYATIQKADGGQFVMESAWERK